MATAGAGTVGSAVGVEETATAGLAGTCLLLENAAASQGIEVSVASLLLAGVTSGALSSVDRFSVERLSVDRLSAALLASLLESGTEKPGSRRSRPLELLPADSAVGFASTVAASGTTGGVASGSATWGLGFGLGAGLLAALAAAR